MIHCLQSKQNISMYFFKGKVNRCPNGIDLETIFRNFLLEKKKKI